MPSFKFQGQRIAYTEFGGGPAAFRAFGQLEVERVSVHGTKATVAMWQPGRTQTQPAFILVATKTPVGWRLIDVSAAEEKKLLKE